MPHYFAFTDSPELRFARVMAAHERARDLEPDHPAKVVECDLLKRDAAILLDEYVFPMNEKYTKKALAALEGAGTRRPDFAGMLDHAARIGRLGPQKLGIRKALETYFDGKLPPLSAIEKATGINMSLAEIELHTNNLTIRGKEWSRFVTFAEQGRGVTVRRDDETRKGPKNLFPKPNKCGTKRSTIFTVSQTLSVVQQRNEQVPGCLLRLGIWTKFVWALRIM
jgi:hypothetical protein